MLGCGPVTYANQVLCQSQKTAKNYARPRLVGDFATQELV
jgi:hypothetical protein